jgi:uncharacterized protein (TIGR03435 family)
MLYRVAVFLAVACAIPAQTPRFAVASIRPADRKSGQGSFWHTTPAGDIRVHDVPMLALITSAYGVQDFQVTGYPDWVTSEYFDVEAKSGEETPLTAAAMQARLQALLAERCGLVVERASREQTGLALTVEGRGHKMRAAEAAPGKTNRNPFGLHAEGITMAQLARTLTIVVKAPVGDETRLAGAYAFDLRYSESPEMAGGTTAPPDGPDVFRALKEQLGLALVRRKVSVEVVVVKRVERPSAN